ncbi:AbrB/MazE/SpoVT family DNA-binding domain-containing protein [Candidatus Woesearchaeota archaeon]|nr:AbrB/MazE/SpoVT family DNA-binding domain-containing protein [Candidatus Woesearchaeota archaeon]
MKRKIVKQGAATMTISLPATWIKKFNLREGDELNIDEIGNKIEISTEKAMGESKIEINADELGGFTKNELSHLYFLGYDEIIINFSNREILNQIKDRLPDCIGYEIIEQTEKKVIIKSISSGLEQEFDNTLRKVFLMLKEMGNNIYDALKNKEFSRLKQIREMETLNNKFTAFLNRIISKKGYKRPDRSLQAYDMIQNLERVADEYKYICDDLKDNKKPIDKNVLELLKKINDYYKLLYEIFYKFDPNKKIALYKDRRTLKNKADEFLKAGKETLLSTHLVNLLEKLYNTAGSYLALSI